MWKAVMKGKVLGNGRACAVLYVGAISFGRRFGERRVMPRRTDVPDSHCRLIMAILSSNVNSRCCFSSKGKRLQKSRIG